MFRLPVLLLILLVRGQAQLFDLASTDDGRELLITSYYRLPGDPPAAPYATTIYRLRDGKWSPLAYSTFLLPPGHR
jgi:hypothetical protein